jgi:hypothetical protein
LTAVPDPFGAGVAASVFLRLRVVLGLSAVVFVAILFLRIFLRGFTRARQG